MNPHPQDNGGTPRRRPERDLDRDYLNMYVEACLEHLNDIQTYLSGPEPDHRRLVRSANYLERAAHNMASASRDIQRWTGLCRAEEYDATGKTIVARCVLPKGHARLEHRYAPTVPKEVERARRIANQANRASHRLDAIAERSYGLAHNPEDPHTFAGSLDDIIDNLDTTADNAIDLSDSLRTRLRALEIRPTTGRPPPTPPDPSLGL